MLTESSELNGSESTKLFHLSNLATFIYKTLKKSLRISSAKSFIFCVALLKKTSAS